MRVKVLMATEAAILALFFFWKFARPASDGSDAAGIAALGAFQLCAAAASLYLLSRGGRNKASPIDWLVCATSISMAGAGFAAYSITLFAAYLLIGGRNDLTTKAAGSVAAALAIQAAWAPLIFAKFSYLFLQIDAGMVGWLVSHVVPGASWSGTIVTTPSGHDVIITAACASFHNLSLASLCWVTLTMLHRPCWTTSDILVGLGAMLIQFGLNVWRLVFVCMSLPMYEFWHDGFGKHIFSAVATACAIVFVQTLLVRGDQNSLHRDMAVS